MKIWFVNSLLLLMCMSHPARGMRAQEGLACLDVGDLACAMEVRDAVVAAGDASDISLVLQMRTAFREGRYADAASIFGTLSSRESELLVRDRNPYESTAKAFRGMVRYEGDSVIVRRAKGVEAVLEEDAALVLEQSRKAYDSLFGGGPTHPVLLDIFPTANRFIMASGLPAEAVRKTGVVALSKWSRLLVSSPRALSRGYGWKDTIAHEYIHLVVSFRSEDRTPVWLQEGLAKLLEGRWRGLSVTPLTVHQKSLLSQAVENDAYVPFEKFKHSMAYLDSGDEAALAFAQVATLVEHVLNQSSDSALAPIMDRIRDGESPQLVVAQAGGYPDFDSLISGWKAWLKTRPLQGTEVATLPVVLDADADDYAQDPLLAADMTRIRAARLGDLLFDRGRPLAALVEYRKAAGEEGPPSPLMMAREAKCLAALGRLDEALDVTRKGLRLYPEFTLLWVTLGRLLDGTPRTDESLKAWNNAYDLNPFSLEVQNALVSGYTAVGRMDAAAKHAEHVRILTTGGATAESR